LANPLEDSFNFILDRAEIWFAAFRNSDRVATTLFAEHSTVRARVRAVTTLWFGSFFLSLVIASPAYYGHGLKDPTFHLTTVLAQYGGLLLTAWCFHRALRIYGVQSQWADTFVLQTTVSAGLAPLFTLAALPGKLRMLEMLVTAKEQKIGLRQLIVQAVWESRTGDGTLEIANAVATPVILAILAVGSARLAPILIRHYAAERWKVVRALAFASAVLAPLPIMGAACLEVVLCYTLRS
jgi:hypothetical protein